MNGGGTPNISPLLHRLVSGALAAEDYEPIFSDLCSDLRNIGLPLLRGHLAMHTLHPLVSSVDLTWLRERGVAVNRRAHAPTPSEQWVRSPLYWMLTHRRKELRQRLRRDDAMPEFPVYAEFRDLGATDYWACFTPFGDPETAFERRDGILTSWLSDAPEGFTAEHIDALKSLQPYIGLVAKLSKHDHTARNVASAYLGEDAGKRVLEGQIRLGDVDHIPAVVWLSDLRDSTAMAERAPAPAFLQALNAYFDCTAGAVLEHGGEVLRFIGDAVLAVFPVPADRSPAEAAEKALGAAREARMRMETLNAGRTEQGEEPLAFGLGLHLGDLLYGNIGVPSRIEFSVIGPVANEVSRLESLTKELGEPVLVSRAFKQALDLPWRDLGGYELKGVAECMEVFAPPE